MKKDIIMSKKSIRINLRVKPKKIEVEMSNDQFESFLVDLQLSSRFIFIGKDLMINKEDIIYIETL